MSAVSVSLIRRQLEALDEQHREGQTAGDVRICFLVQALFATLDHVQDNLIDAPQSALTETERQLRYQARQIVRNCAYWVSSAVEAGPS